jgi:hypothetical protein
VEGSGVGVRRDVVKTVVRVLVFDNKKEECLRYIRKACAAEDITDEYIEKRKIYKTWSNDPWQRQFNAPVLYVHLEEDCFDYIKRWYNCDDVTPYFKVYNDFGKDGYYEVRALLE